MPWDGELTMNEKNLKMIKAQIKEMVNHEKVMLNSLAYGNPDSEEAFMCVASIIQIAGVIVKLKELLKNAK